MMSDLSGSARWGIWRARRSLVICVSLFSVAAALVFLPQAADANSIPSVPDGVSARLDGSTITVSWNEASDSDGAIDGYNIYINEEYTATVKGQTVYTHTVSELSATLTFQVTSFDNGDPQGFSPMSEVALVEISQQEVSGTIDEAQLEPEPAEAGSISTDPEVGADETAAVPVEPDGQFQLDGPVELDGQFQLDGPVELDGQFQLDGTVVESVQPGRLLPPDSLADTGETTPGAPSLVEGGVDGDQVKIQWTTGQVLTGRVGGYNIYRNGTYVDSVSADTYAWSEPVGYRRGLIRYNVVTHDDSNPVKFSPLSAVVAIDLGSGPLTETETSDAINAQVADAYDADIPNDGSESSVDLANCPDGRTQNLIIAGDSWADRVGPFLRRTFTSRGWNVTELGVGSTLSRDWLPGTQNFQTIAAELRLGLGQCADNIVSFSVGGNDLVLPEGGANAFPQNDEDAQARLNLAAQNIIASIDMMRSIDPNVRIVLPGYDLLNPNVTAACLTAANVFSGQPGVTFNPARANDRQQAIRQMYLGIGSARPGVQTPNLLGATQGRLGNPDFESLPPVVYSSADCLHLTGGSNLTGPVADFEEPFGFNGYDIWGSELAMVLDPTLSLTYRLDLSPDEPAPELEDPFDEELLLESNIPEALIVFEAEHFTTRNESSWGRGGATGAIGDAGANAMVSLAGPDSDRADGGRITYEIPISSAGSYDLWIRRRATTIDKDQLTWGFDGVQQQGDGSGGPIGSDFTWVYLGQSELASGIRILDLARMEGELVIDRLAMMKPGIVPLEDGGEANLVPRRAVSSTSATGNSLTIDYNQLYVADAGEEGGFQNGDEPRLVVIEFRTTPGKPGSTVVTNSFRYDGPTGRDDGDTWRIPDNIGRFEYENIVTVNEVDVRGGQLPELVGHVVILLEDEPGSSSPVRRKVQAVSDELERAIVTIIEPLDPVTVAGDPAGLAEDIIEASGLVTDAAKPYNNPGISDTLEDNIRDIGGADVVGFYPMFFLAVDESLVPVIDRAFAEQLQGVSAAGGSLRNRSFQIRRRGSGATYVVDVEVKIDN